MSKDKKDDQMGADLPDLKNDSSDAQQSNGENVSQAANKPELLTIEEHRKNLGIEAPVFAAVMQAEKWAAGKKILEADFLSAVNRFLAGSMGGK